MPDITIGPRTRLVLYILGAVVGPLVAYGYTKGALGEAEVALWGAYAVLLNALSAANVRNNPDPEPATEPDPYADFEHGD